MLSTTSHIRTRIVRGRSTQRPPVPVVTLNLLELADPDQSQDKENINSCNNSIMPKSKDPDIKLVRAVKVCSEANKRPPTPDKNLLCPPSRNPPTISAKEVSPGESVMRSSIMSATTVSSFHDGYSAIHAKRLDPTPTSERVLKRDARKCSCCAGTVQTLTARPLNVRRPTRAQPFNLSRSNSRRPKADSRARSACGIRGRSTFSVLATSFRARPVPEYEFTL